MTGFQSTALSSVDRHLQVATLIDKKLDNAIGYAAIRNDKSDWTEVNVKDGEKVVIDNGKGDNFTDFNTATIRADMVKPDSVLKPIDGVEIGKESATVSKVDTGSGSFNPDFVYNSAVYKNFDQQMQIGHIYGNIRSGIAGDLSRVSNVYVQGHLTDQADLDYLKQVNEGKAKYEGIATYIEKLHLGDFNKVDGSTTLGVTQHNYQTTDMGADPVQGKSSFDVDFVNNSVKGELTFNGDFKYNPSGKIGIVATIDGNTFAGNANGIDTAGGFYGEDAQFLGGIYQDASAMEGASGGKGTTPGTGTRFQGTFGAEKQ
ncbi:transferrin-binding protein-like solute binding protein [Psychrobacter raelei]|uniref:transferrin-binding protein-like solute binding protein n=1 Tax=Psychrobacter raelei TaxID=2565531 RepID=UPI003F62AE08